jgi:hypothetical protein
MLTRLVDNLINLLKWPIALLTLFLLPDITLAIGDEIAKLSSKVLIPLTVGIAAYFVLWKLLFTRRLWGSWLPTLEHELTHTIFALITLHKVTNFHTSYEKGGHVQYVGGPGNWLITIAPYFFPTFVALLLVLDFYLPLLQRDLFILMLGFVVSFHVISTLTETNAKQPDLIKVGLLFCWCFLPGANLFFIGWLIFALLERGAVTYICSIYNYSIQHAELLIALANQQLT